MGKTQSQDSSDSEVDSADSEAEADSTNQHKTNQRVLVPTSETDSTNPVKDLFSKNQQTPSNTQFSAGVGTNIFYEEQRSYVECIQNHGTTLSNEEISECYDKHVDGAVRIEGEQTEQEIVSLSQENKAVTHEETTTGYRVKSNVEHEDVEIALRRVETNIENICRERAEDAIDKSIQETATGYEVTASCLIVTKPFTIPICKEIGSELNSEEKELARNGFRFAQREAAKQGVLLEKTDDETHCVKVEYLDQANYLEADMALDREQLTYSEEIQRVKEHAEEHGLQVWDNLEKSMGRAEGVETKISIPQIVEAARNRDVPEELTKEMKEAILGRTTYHEIGHASGLIHPNTVPHVPDEIKEVLEIVIGAQPNIMAYRSVKVKGNSIDTNKAFDITDKQLWTMKEANTPGTDLYEAVRQENALGLLPLLEWHRDNLNRDEALEYAGVEHAYRTLMSETDDENTKSRLETLRLD